MAKLTKNSTPAERRRGCVFAETFESTAAVVANDGVITGTPTISNGVVTLNGTTDYISYDDQDRLSFGDGTTDKPFTMSAWINPTDASNINICSKGRYTASGEYRYYTGATDRMLLRIYDESVVACYLGAYDPTPLTALQGQWVHVAATYDASGTSAGIKLYRNGLSVTPTISENNAGSYVAMENLAGPFYIGQNNGDYTEGQISDVKVFNKELSAAEIYDIYSGEVYNYRNKAVLDLPMRAEEHDTINSKTLDVSISENSFQLGDGSTAATFPTKLSNHGYELDGTDDYFTYSSPNTAQSALSIAIEFAPDFDYDEDAVTYLYGSSADSLYAAIKQNNASSNTLDIYMGGELIASVPSATYSPAWLKGQRNILIVSATPGDGMDNTSNAWLNGVQIITNATVEWYTGSPTTFAIGSSFTPEYYFDGKIYSFQIFPRALTKTQVEDLIIEIQKKVNKI